MSMDVHFEPLPDIDIDREYVEEETSLARLNAWDRHFSQMEDEIRIRLNAMKEAGVDGHRMGSKLGFVRVARSWINRRKIQLTEEASPEPDLKGMYERQRQQIEHLQEVITRRNERIAILERKLSAYGETVE